MRITAGDLAARYENARLHAAQAGWDPDRIALTCCRPIELTSPPVEQVPDRLMGNPDQLVVALRAFEKTGVQHVALQFMVAQWPERQERIERFARDALPAFRAASNP